MSIYTYIFTMALTTYLVRVIPLTVFRKPIKSVFLKSFLHYVPYACLTAMTFPAILSSTATLLSGAAALVVAVVLAYRGKSLLTVSLAASAAVMLIISLCASPGLARPSCTNRR
jgi:branched-subunit amino acid transport protein